MPVNFSIKNVPDKIADRLKRRAAKNHRSLQGELMAIIESAVADVDNYTPHDLLDTVRSLGLKTSSESSAIVRQDRDKR